jgi:hypothetical protein
VRLNTGETAVVLKTHAADPHRPQVRMLTSRDGARLDLRYDVNLWENDDAGRPASIVAPIDPAAFGVDPLTLM